MFLPIYASPNPALKFIMWHELLEVSSVPELPWLVAGDMNDMASSFEKWSGRDFNHHRAAVFNKRAIDCHLMDFGFKGPSYTWVGKRQGCSVVKERLDRALTSEEWRLRFPEASVFHILAYSLTTVLCLLILKEEGGGVQGSKINLFVLRRLGRTTRGWST